MAIELPLIYLYRWSMVFFFNVSFYLFIFYLIFTKYAAVDRLMSFSLAIKLTPLSLPKKRFS